MSDAKTINCLKDTIAYLDHCYRFGEPCIDPDTEIEYSDGEYDAMRRELAELLTDGWEDPFFGKPSADNGIGGLPKIKHDPPMCSISKASHEDRATQSAMLLKWIQQNASSLGITKVRWDKYDLVMSYKLDGVALSLYYENGILKEAGLRGSDAVTGENVTVQARHIKDVPDTLPMNVTCCVRGEIICTDSDFEKVQEWLESIDEEPRANPRNHSAGAVRNEDIERVKNSRLRFVAYAIENLEDAPYETEIERADFARNKLGFQYIKIESYDIDRLKEMENKAEDLDFEVDGTVIAINNLSDQEGLGRTGDSKTGNPKGKIAWKFAEERVTAEVKDIEWKTGRTGSIKPVAVFDPVRLAGTNVSRATLHNIGFMIRHKIDIETKIVVLKAGKIIPKVIGTAGGEIKKGQKPKYPRHCPSCNALTHINGDVDNEDAICELICLGTQCPAQNIRGMLHYLKTFGVLGIGESKVTQLVESNKIKNFADFYRLTVEEAMICGLSERQSLLAIASIHLISAPFKIKDNDELAAKIKQARQQKKVVPMWKLFACFGIEMAGRSTGKVLMNNFGSFDMIRKASVEDIAAINDIGQKTAEVIVGYLKDNSADIDDLFDFVEIEGVKVGELTGKRFVLTGGFPDGKKFWEDEIEQKGGQCSSSVSKKTDYVIEGTDAGAKAEKAKTLNIPLLSLDELKEMLGV